MLWLNTKPYLYVDTYTVILLFTANLSMGLKFIHYIDHLHVAYISCTIYGVNSLF